MSHTGMEGHGKKTEAEELWENTDGEVWFSDNPLSMETRRVTSLLCTADKDFIHKLTILNSLEHQTLASQVDLKTGR